MRRLKYSLLLLLLLFWGSLFAEPLTRTKVALGTFVSISADERYSKEIEAAFGIIEDVEASLSSYDKNSPIYKLNQRKKADINRYTFEALELSKKYYKESGGYFNIGVGSITKDLYRFGEDERVPHAKELQAADLSFEALSFNKKEATLKKNIKIDLGGMGKGFAVDKVTEYFKSNGITNAVIAASGDIRCIGSCKVKIQNPHAKTFLVDFETLKNDTGVSTSGNYNRYVNTTEHNHLIDPKLKKSAQNFVSVTLVSQIPNSDLDAYATAISVMPKKKAYSFLKRLPVAYILLETEGKLQVSDNLKHFVKNIKFSKNYL